jgi:hypothetical protein
MVYIPLCFIYFIIIIVNVFEVHVLLMLFYIMVIFIFCKHKLYILVEVVVQLFKITQYIYIWKHNYYSFEKNAGWNWIFC